jgi:mannose-6-phosphate isomerase
MLEAQYAILVATDGAGELRPSSGDPLPVRRGDTILIPYAAGECFLSGPVDCIRCMPPQSLA